MATDPSMASVMSHATLCSGRTSWVSTMPPSAGEMSSGGANSMVAISSSSASSTRRSATAGLAPEGGVGGATEADALAPGVADEPGRREGADQRGHPATTNGMAGLMGSSEVLPSSGGTARAGAAARAAPWLA